MRIIINVKEIGRKIGIEAKLDTGCQDTARERAAGDTVVGNRRKGREDLQGDC